MRTVSNILPNSPTTVSVLPHHFHSLRPNFAPISEPTFSTSHTILTSHPARTDHTDL